MRIEHDGSGVGAGWNLERVIVREAQGDLKRMYVFEVNRWLASDMADGKLWTEVDANEALGTNGYRVQVPNDLLTYLSSLIY